MLPFSSFEGLLAIIGRKIPLFIGMALFVIGSVGCAMSDAMAALFLARISGRGRVRRTDVEPSQNRKIRSDLFGSSQAAQMLSMLVIIMAIAPIVGPLLGGAILEFGSWHGIFWLMALASAIMFAMIFSLPETLPPQKRSTKPIVSSFRNYLRLLQDAKFMRYTLSVTFFALPPMPLSRAHRLYISITSAFLANTTDFYSA